MKPREVFMLAYCRVDGSADWQAEAGLSSMGDSGGVALGDVAGPGASAVDDQEEQKENTIIIGGSSVEIVYFI